MAVAKKSGGSQTPKKRRWRDMILTDIKTILEIVFLLCEILLLLKKIFAEVKKNKKNRRSSRKDK